VKYTQLAIKKGIDEMVRREQGLTGTASEWRRKWCIDE
jgi:hypothetical protein